MSDADHLSRVDDDFEAEYPGADAVASEAFVNLVRVGDRLDADCLVGSGKKLVCPRRG